MAWRVCRVLDFEKHCTSIHSSEDIAKIETGRQLAALITKLQEDLPGYFGYRHYPKYYPGFVEDAAQMIETAAQMIETAGYLLQEEEVWGAYDEWHRFMNRWEGVLHLPLWVEIGTVIVDGPGPTVESMYHPLAGIEKNPKRHKILDVKWELRKTFYTFYKTIAEEIFNTLGAEGRPQPPVGEIRRTVETLSTEINIGPWKSQELVDHWSKLVREEAFRHFGLSP
jgi:hypothetical protein